MSFLLNLWVRHLARIHFTSEQQMWYFEELHKSQETIIDEELHFAVVYSNVHSAVLYLQCRVGQTHMAAGLCFTTIFVILRGICYTLMLLMLLC